MNGTVKMRNGGTAKAKTCRGGVEVCVWGGGQCQGKQHERAQEKKPRREERRDCVRLAWRY